MNQIIAPARAPGIAPAGGRAVAVTDFNRSSSRSHTVPKFVEALGGSEGRQLRLQMDTQWRRRPKPSEHPGIQISRWKEEKQEVRQYSTSGSCEYITVDIALRYTEVTFWVGEQCVHQGGLKAGTALVTWAGLPIRAELRGPCDVLRILVPAALCLYMSRMAGFAPAQTPPQLNPVIQDAAIERLAWSLMRVEDLKPTAAELYVEAITTAILARLLNPNLHRSKVEHPVTDGLPKWRLKRVLNFIEANLAEPLSLERLAACAGLSRMYFAAQFKAATGVRPHEYLIRRRVEFASELLRETTKPLVEIALDVGFQTQAHFTTVFRRLMGETPNRWRQKHRKAEPEAGREPPVPSGNTRG
jgi:AraC-like DNA-binding protein